MKTKRNFIRIAAATTAFAIAAGGLVLWTATSAEAAVRDGFARFQAARNARETVHAILTAEQRAVLEAFRAESKELRTDRRDFLHAQRDLLADFQLTPRQWEQLSGVVDTHGQTIIDAVMRVVDGRVALREATLAENGSEEAMRDAAAALGIALGDAAVVVNAAVEDARALLSPAQQAMLNTVTDNVSARRDETRYAMADRFLELRSDLDLTGAQKAAIAKALREVLSQLPLDFGPEL